MDHGTNRYGCAMMPSTGRDGDGTPPRKALVTGITGQDGSYLAELLISKGYEVHGVIRRASLFNTDRIDHLYTDPHRSGGHLTLHYGDLTEATSIRRILEGVQPDEIYHLGAQSHVMVSFAEPEYTCETTGMGTLRLLEAVRDYVERTQRIVRIYNAGSSEMFGSSPPPQNEATPFRPRSPYAVGKVAAHWHGVNYREAYGLFICNGILFNHESPRRGETFVSRKLTRAAGRIHEGLQEEVFLGNLAARRDWGYAGDFVRAMWAMLQHPVPGDYVIGTGVSHSVRDLAERAFARVGLDWQHHVVEDPRYRRPTEVDALEADASFAERELGWTPVVSFEELVDTMVDHDLDLAKQERLLTDAGHAVVSRGAADRH